MAEISFEDFVKLEIKIGKILSAERVEGSDKLLKLLVDFGVEAKPTNLVGKESEDAKEQGEEKGEEKEQGEEVEVKAPERITRQIIAGIAQYYAPEALVGKECPFAYNLAPRMLKGLESQGMILCPSGENGPVLLHPDKEVPPGSTIK